MICSLIIAKENEAQAELCKSLAANGMACSVTPYNNEVLENIVEQQPDIVLLELDEQLSDIKARELIQSLKKDRRLFVIAIIPRETLAGIDRQLNADDFITSPCDVRELILRVNRLIYKTKSKGKDELIECGDLVIDIPN